jgi:GntR family transcriptional regulator
MNGGTGAVPSTTEQGVSLRSDLHDRPGTGASEIRAEGGSGARRPLYLAVCQALQQGVREGRWPVGSSLPSEADLSREFAVSRITVRHALRLLETEGYIRKARARRPVVMASTPGRTSGWAVESLDDIIAMVGNARLQIESWGKERSSDAARLLEVPGPTALHCLRSVLVRDGRPYSRSIIYFPPLIGVALTRSSFNDAVVFRVLQRELGLSLRDVRLTVSAELAATDDAVALGCDVGSPLLVMELVYRSEADQVVEVAYSRSLASEVRLSTRLATHSGG